MAVIFSNGQEQDCALDVSAGLKSKTRNGPEICNILNKFPVQQRSDEGRLS